MQIRNAILKHILPYGIVVQQQLAGQLLYLQITHNQFDKIFADNTLALNHGCDIEFELSSWQFNNKYYTKATLISICSPSYPGGYL